MTMKKNLIDLHIWTREWVDGSNNFFVARQLVCAIIQVITTEDQLKNILRTNKDPDTQNSQIWDIYTRTYDIAMKIDNSRLVDDPCEDLRDELGKRRFLHRLTIYFPKFANDIWLLYLTNLNVFYNYFDNGFNDFRMNFCYPPDREMINEKYKKKEWNSFFGDFAQLFFLNRCFTVSYMGYSSPLEYIIKTKEGSKLDKYHTELVKKIESTKSLSRIQTLQYHLIFLKKIIHAEKQKTQKPKQMLRHISFLEGKIKFVKSQIKPLEKTNKTIHNLLLHQGIFHNDSARKASFEKACTLTRGEYQAQYSNQILTLALGKRICK